MFVLLLAARLRLRLRARSLWRLGWVSTPDALNAGITLSIRGSRSSSTTRIVLPNAASISQQLCPRNYFDSPAKVSSSDCSKPAAPPVNWEALSFLSRISVGESSPLCLNETFRHSLFECLRSNQNQRCMTAQSGVALLQNFPRIPNICYFTYMQINCPTDSWALTTPVLTKNLELIGFAEVREVKKIALSMLAEHMTRIMVVARKPAPKERAEAETDQRAKGVPVG